MQLRPYQNKIIEQTRSLMRKGVKSIVICSPTGSGKTALTAQMLNTAASKGMSSIFIVHRRELIKQSMQTFTEAGIDCSIVAAGFRFFNRQLVTIASIQTLKNRLSIINEPKLIVWDECHHCASKSYIRIREKFPNSYHIGLSATPERLDNKGLSDCFSQIVEGPPVQWLIDNGFLSSYKIYAPKTVDVSMIHTKMGDFDQVELSNELDKPSITGDAINEYKKYANGKRAIIRGVSIKHSQHIAEQFNKAGIHSLHLDGTTSTAIRDSALESFRAGKILVLVNVDLFGEGLDIPSVECVIDLRPTQSLILWLQFCGRALRPHPGKQHAIIIDHAGNSARHGLPCDIRQWTLQGKPKRKKGDPEPVIAVRTCSQCYFVCKASCTKCPDCGHEFEVQSREIQHVDGELSEIDVEKMRRERLKVQGMAKTREELIELGKARGYKNPSAWAYYVTKNRKNKKAVAW